MALASAGGSSCVFTRFLTARNAEAASGSWQRYYRHWQLVTHDILADGAIEVHLSLQPYVHPARSFDKLTHDAFDSPTFSAHVSASTPTL